MRTAHVSFYGLHFGNDQGAQLSAKIGALGVAAMKLHRSRLVPVDGKQAHNGLGIDHIAAGTDIDLTLMLIGQITETLYVVQ